MLNTCGSVDSDIWTNDEIDNWRSNNIPIFQTEAECERYKKFREDVKTRSYEFSEEEWEDEIINKFTFYYNYEFGKFMVCSDSKYKNFNQIYFKTEEDAQYIKDTYPEELKKWRV